MCVVSAYVSFFPGLSEGPLQFLLKQVYSTSKGLWTTESLSELVWGRGGGGGEGGRRGGGVGGGVVRAY